MSISIITDSDLTSIANAIREKNSSSNTYTPLQMATAITNLPSGGGSTYTATVQDQSTEVMVAYWDSNDNLLNYDFSASYQSGNLALFYSPNQYNIEIIGNTTSTSYTYDALDGDYFYAFEMPSEDVTITAT